MNRRATIAPSLRDDIGPEFVSSVEMRARTQTVPVAPPREAVHRAARFPAVCAARPPILEIEALEQLVLGAEEAAVRDDGARALVGPDLADGVGAEVRLGLADLRAGGRAREADRGIRLLCRAGGGAARVVARGEVG